VTIFLFAYNARSLFVLLHLSRKTRAKRFEGRFLFGLLLDPSHEMMTEVLQPSGGWNSISVHFHVRTSIRHSGGSSFLLIPYRIVLCAVGV
jgi:hypothetical protein